MKIINLMSAEFAHSAEVICYPSLSVQALTNLPSCQVQVNLFAGKQNVF